MTKQDFKTIVGNGFFSCAWIKNNGQVGIVKRAILGEHAHRHTNNPQLPIREHQDYVLGFRVGNGLLPEHKRWVNINPTTVFKLNGVKYARQ
jgi:hypothetical protein